MARPFSDPLTNIFSIRTPASTTGVPIYGGRGGSCFGANTKSTFMVQFCWGTGDCTSAGVKRDDLLESQANTFTSAIFADADGNLIIPRSVGDESGDKFETFMEDHGLNASSMVKSRSASGVPIYKIGYGRDAPVQKRACDDFVQDGAPYTKTVSGYICDSTSEVTITNKNSISRTTTFGASLSDPWGIISASTEMSFEESAS
ncbi:hypothetical protein EK21DRAFT_112904 [Setomelanomma holmii]|uniref:Uncharacterized protein n=1 Tax=Setomelanomma holmii TaxID=210430 RepID=A0A9P4H8L9_9PLEO|nr:hypothetical protein EK21DRAFT_112904 [Setomelanomma holmii]